MNWPGVFIGGPGKPGKMMKNAEADNGIGGGVAAEAAAVLRRSYLSGLVAIYDSHKKRRDTPQQIGTGFLLLHKSQPVLVTAKHVLRGHGLDENPAEKAVHLNGQWVYVGDGNRELVEPKCRDLAMAYFNEFPIDRCLDTSRLATAAYTPRIITLAGYLARDFKREKNILRPAPRIYSNIGIDIDAGFGLVAMKYPKRRNIDSETGKAAVTSTPSGLSGGLMVDTGLLIRGVLVVVGVFSEMDQGQARGENIDLIRATLNAM